MNIPEFTAQASLYRTNIRYRSVAFARASAHGTVVIPQAGGPGAPGHAACLSDCADQHPDWTRKQCLAACRDPGGTPACTPHDNTINHLACLGGVAFWETACVTGCTGTGILDPLCSFGCQELAAGFRRDCPPAVICI
jgi:hypothetical protein